ncbi:YdeI/OmpD-associated family protein [Fulvivirgaceae bacterium BMA10]|uniref:YdeI/OmpD-associated family protein n=1 Tax=Splendidivirga corallicola TaxID=3051826 RepID=A0ABT8KIV1_9BACT|nr:YdeI/OmpD-associated family protein [Fulvivirgaceae bacterium BMA10]
MSDQALLKKLHIKPGFQCLVLNAPKAYLDRLEGSMLQSEVKGAKDRYDFVQLFGRHRKELDKVLPEAIKAKKKDGSLWISYPKKSAKVDSDLSREVLWEQLSTYGFDAVSMISVDDVWSSMRFKFIGQQPTNKPTINKTQVFEAIIEKPDPGSDAACISIPFDVQDVYGTKGQVKVKATFDGYEYRGVIANMGTGSHIIILTKAVRKAIGKDHGDQIKVTLLKDTEERVITIPDYFQKLLDQDQKIKSFFNSLSYTNRKEYINWMEGAKKQETKDRRIWQSLEKLEKGIKNPFAK